MPSKLTKTKHPHLFRDEASGYFYYRRYSSLKRRQYFKTTGEKLSAARAYRFGLEAFNDWIGSVSDEVGKVYFDRFAEKFLDRRLSNDAIRSRTKVLSEYEVKQLTEAFGHLELKQITAERYEEWVKDAKGAGKRQKFFNAKKALIQILREAQAAGHLQKLPKLPNTDAPAQEPTYLSRHTIRAILRNCTSPNCKLLGFIMWKQGARPGEILQYEWRMIDWKDGAYGSITIPGRITKTKRSRTIPLNSRVSWVLKRLWKQKPQSPFIFASSRVLSAPYQQYDKNWKAACAAAKVGPVILYALRDSFVTDKLKAGRSLAFIAKYVDSSPKELAMRYAVAEEEAMRGVAG